MLVFSCSIRIAASPRLPTLKSAQSASSISSPTWVVGDRGRDIRPARKLGIKTIQIGNDIEKEDRADFEAKNLFEAVKTINDQRLPAGRQDQRPTNNDY